jgi:parvulin-like peptidyl-prolyl isomerase
VTYFEAEMAPILIERTREAALGRAQEAARRLRAGEDFESLCRAFSDGPEARRSGVLGTFPPGVLADAAERFLWSADPFDVSYPHEAPGGIQVLQRIERWAACRVIVVRGIDEVARARAQALWLRALRGADFGDLAREASDDRESAERGGAWRIFERGPDDQLIKRAIFDVQIGEILAPIAIGASLHVAKRVALEELDPALREDPWLRGRAILLVYGDGRRSPGAARELVHDLHARAAKGEDFAALASAHTDEPGGAERGGDLGWLHRHSGAHVAVLDRLWSLAPGEAGEPIPLEGAWLLLQRAPRRP